MKSAEILAQSIIALSLFTGMVIAWLRWKRETAILWSLAFIVSCTGFTVPLFWKLVPLTGAFALALLAGINSNAPDQLAYVLRDKREAIAGIATALAALFVVLLWPHTKSPYVGMIALTASLGAIFVNRRHLQIYFGSSAAKDEAKIVLKTVSLPLTPASPPAAPENANTRSDGLPSDPIKRHEIMTSPEINGERG